MEHLGALHGSEVGRDDDGVLGQVLLQVLGQRRNRRGVLDGQREAALDRARPALEAISARITHMGPVGSGQATKAVNQIIKERRDIIGED